MKKRFTIISDSLSFWSLNKKYYQKNINFKKLIYKKLSWFKYVKWEFSIFQ